MNKVEHDTRLSALIIKFCRDIDELNGNEFDTKLVSLIKQPNRNWNTGSATEEHKE